VAEVMRTNTFASKTHAFRIYAAQVTRASNAENGQRSREHSWTYWRLCSRRHAIRTYSCARRWPWKSVYRNHGFR